MCQRGIAWPRLHAGARSLRQKQLPEWQSLPAEQALPHAPQLLELVLRFTHAPAHDEKPAAQLVEQAPAAQLVPEQSLSLAQLRRHAPPEQTCAAVQALPQAPQF